MIPKPSTTVPQSPVKRKAGKPIRSSSEKLETLLKARLAISELVALYRKEAEHWPGNLPNYYLAQSEELNRLYNSLLDWEVDISRQSR